MSKVKPIRDLKAQEPQAPNMPKTIELTKDNAPLLAAKFLEEIRNEFRRMNATLERMEKNG